MGPRILVLACLAAAAGAAQAPIRVDVRLVNAGFVVRDSAGRLVTDLEKDDFEVFEDGAQQRIAFFGRGADVPLDLGLVVDVSGSQEPFGKQHHKDLEMFLKSVLDERDRAFLVCFGNRVRLVEDFSGSARELAGALRAFRSMRHPYQEIGPPELRLQGTAFFDAIYHSIREKLAPVETGRRALIVFSDGQDNSSAHHLLDAVETAQASDVRLFTIHYGDPESSGKHEKRMQFGARTKYGISVMQRLARETGGTAFDARESDLAEGFRRIGAELRASYELAYHTTNPLSDGTFHKITIRVKKPGLAVRAKTGYFAPAADCAGQTSDCSPQGR